MEISKQYDPKKVEDEIYKSWENSGYFNPDNLKGDPYSIMMPPPNVTGVLHLGHAWENSLMDIMARYQRMQGKKVLLLPGTDHAAVATQAKVEKILMEKGIKNPRQELGREKLLEEIRNFSEKSKATILSQIKKMGTSCDWSRLAYTFDEERSRAVSEVFKKMYDDGLIYRGHRVVNWSVKGQCTCSDDELEYIERPAKLYTFKYSHDFPISIATTRPETKLGDTAVAVNPKDKRYKKYIGQTFTADVGAEKPLNIKIIADENIDVNFGTGAVGVTPAHSMADFEMYEKQKAKGNPIGFVTVIDEHGRVNAGKNYAGLTVEKAREKFVVWLKENKLLEKEEEITQNVGTSDRFGDVVEVLPKIQWFVAVNKKIPGKEKSLKELMREAVAVGHNGDPKQKVKITPERFEKTYFSWIDNLRDWCISRQIWWGHQIPVWYCGERARTIKKMGFAGDIVVQVFDTKTRTYRLRDHGINVGDIVAFEDSAKKVIFGYGTITEVSVTTVGQIDLNDKKHWKTYKKREDLIAAFKRHHPEKEINNNTKAWLYTYTFDHNLPNNGCGTTIVSIKTPEKCPSCAKKENLKQDPDTLDTWFSSGLWTFSTLGWSASIKTTAGKPEKIGDLKDFHPTKWMQMGYEIIFFWMARMILMSTYTLNQIPFHDVYIHGILRDEKGRKFSKSDGNTLDPLHIIEKYGTDALRLSLISGTTPGLDSKFCEEKVEASRNFVNKLWNISRYILLSDQKIEEMPKVKSLLPSDIWIMQKFCSIIKNTKDNLEKFQFSQASEKLMEFTKNDLADWYLEVAKFEDNKYVKAWILRNILEDLLKMWHPFIPFVTENIWANFDKKSPLLIESWPLEKTYQIETEDWKKENHFRYFELIKNVVSAVRTIRTENKIDLKSKLAVVIRIPSQENQLFKTVIEKEIEIIKKLRTGIESITVEISDKSLKNAYHAFVGAIDVCVPMEGLIDIKKEKAKAEKELVELEKYITSIKGKLKNKSFMGKAPEAVVNQQKESLEKAQAKFEEIKRHLKELK